MLKRTSLIIVLLFIMLHHAFAVQRQLWNLQDADIRAVAQTVAQLTGKNFIIDPRVQGKVTLISSHPLNAKQVYPVFLSMLQVVNCAAISTGQVIKIVPAMDAKGYAGALLNRHAAGDQLVVRVVTVNNVSAEQLVPVLRPLMLDWGSVSAYIPSNSLVLAGPAANIQQLLRIIEHLDHHNVAAVQVVKLRYASAGPLSQVVQSLQSINNSQGKMNSASVVADHEANALLVSGNQTNRKKTIALIKELDTPGAVAGNNTGVVPLNYLTAKKIAPVLSRLAKGYAEQNRHKDNNSEATFGVGEHAPTVSIQAIAEDNTLIINAPHAVLQNLKAVIKKIDRRPQEVLVQAIIVRLDETAFTHLGIQWGVSDSAHGITINPGMGALSQAVTNGIGFIRNGSFRALVTALMSNGNNDILATPSVLVLNNQKALISDGKNVGIFNRQYAASSTDHANNESTLPYNTYDRKDVTLSLEVTPQIAPDNTVKLVIQHENDTLAADVQGQDPNNPTINTSKINTAVLVNSGDILVLGGLISNNTTELDQKIPVLGDIPLLGRLFHNKKHTLTKKNLLVFIRPVIINNRREAQKQSLKQYHYIRAQHTDKKIKLPAEF